MVREDPRSQTPERPRKLRRFYSDEVTDKPRAPPRVCAPRIVAEKPLSAPPLAVLTGRNFSVPARESECEEIARFLNQTLGTSSSSSGGSLYVSGRPGTGKTFSVRAAAAAWKELRPETMVIYINCFELQKPSVESLLRRLGHVGSIPLQLPKGASIASIAAAVTARLARLAPSVILIIDEFDQVIGSARGDEPALEKELFGLHRLPGAPPLALFAIANAVDLLCRTAKLPPGLCTSLLFETYSLEQLRTIAKVRLAAAGIQAEEAAPLLKKLELALRQIAGNRSGDCRALASACEQAAIEAKEQAEGPGQQPSPLGNKASGNPVLQLPLAQQLLLCSIVTLKDQEAAVRLSALVKRYKEMCRQFKQPDADKDQVRQFLVALEQRGLVEAESPSKTRRCGVDRLVQLTIPLDRMRQNLESVPGVARCLEG